MTFEARRIDTHVVSSGEEVSRETRKLAGHVRRLDSKYEIDRPAADLPILRFGFIGRDDDEYLIALKY